jgi:hypothetical protein
MMRLFLTLCACLLLGGGSRQLFAAEGTASDQAHAVAHPEADDILTAVFRHQFVKNASGQQQKAGVYFLRILTNETKKVFPGRGDVSRPNFNNGVDPSEAFMESFAKHVPPVRKASQARIDPQGLVLDKETDAQGLLFFAGPINRISDTKVEVPGGYHEGRLSGSYNIYTVEKLDGKWTVTKNQMKAIAKFQRDNRVWRSRLPRV